MNKKSLISLSQQPIKPFGVLLEYLSKKQKE